MSQTSPATLQISRARPSDGRDPLLDMVRALALLVVVVWHWAFTSIRWADDGPHVGNPVAVTPGMWLLTWFLQIMPAFFIVGGALHSMDRTRAGDFWKRRVKRLIMPVLPLLIPAAIALVTTASLGRRDLFRGVILVISPMWFLATYLVCVAVKPAAKGLHDHYGQAVVVAGLLAALWIDWLRIGLGIGGVTTGMLAFVVVWSTVHQLGFSLAALRAASRRTQLAVAVLGYGALGFAAWVAPYPAAMVGLDGHKLSNMGPPTAMVVFLAVGQMGLIALAAPALDRFARTHRKLLAAAGDWSMTIYAWHLVTFAVFYALVVRLGLSVNSRIDVAWWIQRPLWFVGPLILAVPLCRFTRRFDGSRSATPSVLPSRERSAGG